MSEILDEQVPEVQPEPKPETFRQAMNEPEQEAPPAPEPAPEPEADAPPVVPDWLNERIEPEPQAQQQQYQQQPQYQQQQPQYVQPQPPAGGLDAFIENPDAYIEQRAQKIAQQMLGPVAYQQQLIQQRADAAHQSQVKSQAGAADAAIKRAYEGFNKDQLFKKDRNIQGQIKGILSSMKEQAVYEAQQFGDFRKLYNMANIGEREIQATLAVAKIQAGTAGGSSQPLSMEGAVVESSRPSSPKPQVQLTKEQQAIADRFGGDYADRLRKAISESNAAGDFEG